MERLTDKFRYGNAQKGSFDVYCLRDDSWSKSKHKLLIITQHVLRDDIKNHQLLSTRDSKETFLKYIKCSFDCANRFDQAVPTFSYAVINFNDANVAGLTDDRLAEKNAEFTKRALYMINKLKPTHVLISGVSAPRLLFAELFPDVDHVDYKRGWVFEKDDVKYCCTLDLFRALLQDETANCVGFAFQHLANLLIGKNPFTVDISVPEYKYIRTIDEFDVLMKELYASKYFGYDLETRGLTVNDNAIYTAQFTPSQTPNIGYVLTIDHPQSHWSKEDRVYIKKNLRKFFAGRGKPFAITYNGMFDLRITRQCLKMPIINRTCWELMAGEHDLDENVNKLTTAYGVPQGNLRACLCRYGNDFYFKNAFTKEDRSTIGNVAIDGHDVLMYCAADTVFAVAVFKQQIQRASYIKIANKVPYKPYFINHMLNIMSDTAHALSHLRQDGSYIDMDYMAVLRSKDSPLGKQLQEVQQEMFTQSQVKEANQLLLDREGFKSTSLFGSASAQWILSLTKPDHKSALFFDTMKLKPVSYTKQGAPAVDDAFREAYKYSNAVVSLYDDYQQINKLLNTYIKSWNKILTLTDTDAIKDHRLRPDYAFYNVLTGRLGSRNPSLQVIPQHSNIAKHIKRAFIAPPGCLLIHYDYNAQEVRTWGIAAHDNNIADTFRVGQKLRQLYIQDPTPENKDRIKKEGDVHCLNVKRFFGRQVDKKHPLRALVKGVVFATIYMMSAKSMGEQIKGADIIDAKTKIHDAWLKTQDNKLSAKEKAAANKELATASKALQTILEEDRTELAQSTMDKVFSEFKNGKRWLDDAVNMATHYGYAISPVGRVRHVPSALITDKKTASRSIRQSCNAPIQGFASELAIVASRLAMQSYYDHYKEIADMLGIEEKASNNRIQYLRVVHDANYYAIPYKFVIPFLHIMQYEATYGTAAAIKRNFNFEFNIEPEIEMEVGICDSTSYPWDWSIPSLLQAISSAIKEGRENGFIKEDYNDVMEQILHPWRDEKCRHHLNTHFPLLGVKELDDVIGKALNDYDEQSSKNS